MLGLALVSIWEGKDPEALLNKWILVHCHLGSIGPSVTGLHFFFILLDLIQSCAMTGMKARL